MHPPPVRAWRVRAENRKSGMQQTASEGVRGYYRECLCRRSGSTAVPRTTTTSLCSRPVTISPAHRLSPQSGLIARPCAFLRSSRISPHSAGMRAEAGSSTCRARKETVLTAPSSGRSTACVAGSPSSPRTSTAPRTRPRSPTCSGRVGSLRTTHMSTGAGSVAPGRERPGSGPVRSRRRWRRSGSTRIATNMRRNPADRSCHRQARWLPLLRHLACESESAAWRARCGCSRASLCPSPAGSRWPTALPVQRWVCTWAKSCTESLWCPAWRWPHSPWCPRRLVPSRSAPRKALTCPGCRPPPRPPSAHPPWSV